MKYTMFERGLLFYPLKDKGKKFSIITTYSIKLRNEDFGMDVLNFKDSENVAINLTIIFKRWEEILWKKIQEVVPKSLLEEVDWIHPLIVGIDNFDGKPSMEIIVDLLKEST